MYQVGDLDTVLAKAFPQCAPPRTAKFARWLEQYNAINAAIREYTANGTRYSRTTKYGMMRSALYKHLEGRPLSACDIRAQKAGRKISDAQAEKEIRQTYKTLAKEWKDRASHKERGQIIQIAAILAAVVTAGAAAMAAAGAASAGGAGIGASITAGTKAAAASALGIEGGATMTVKQLGMAALKKIAIKEGTEAALGYAAEALAKQSGGAEMSDADRAQLEKELKAAEAEYARLTKRGIPKREAERRAYQPQGILIPLALAAFAAKMGL